MASPITIKKLFVVFGATGNQGSSILKTFLSDPILIEQFTLRGVTRDPNKESARAWGEMGVEMVKGDLDDKESLRKAIKGAYAVFSVTNWQEVLNKEREVAQGKRVGDVCKEMDVKHLIWSSLPDVTKITNGTNTGVLHFDSKAIVEEYIKEIGIPSTFLLLAIFMPYTLFQLSPLSSHSPSAPKKYTLTLPIPTTTKYPLISVVSDTGKYVKSILLSPSTTLGKQILAGEKEYSVEEIAEIFRRVGGLDVVAKEVDGGLYKKGLEGKGYPGWLADDLLDNLRFIREYGFFGGEGCERDHVILTEKLETFEEWVGNSEEVAALK